MSSHEVDTSVTTASIGEQPGSRSWLRPAVAVAAIGWGANQFAPMIVLYQQHGVSAAASEAMFGLYAVGLIPALLLGGRWSDRYGRKSLLVAAVGVSAAASAILLAGAMWAQLLFLGRLVAGIGSGLGFGTGAAWIRECSAGSSDHHIGARRATIAMTVGFGGGPLVAGVIAQWAPHPQAWPYTPHLVLCLAALVLLRRAPAASLSPTAAMRAVDQGRSLLRHLLVITVPFAPWVFVTAAVALAYLPAIVAPSAGPYPLVFAAIVTAIPALTGVLVQPLVGSTAHRPMATLLVPAMTVAVAALVAAIGAAAIATVPAVVGAAAVLGAAYGVLQYVGLADIQHAARPGQLGLATASYQAVSYLGFAAPYLLVLSHSAFGWTPVTGLIAVLVLAVIATLWIAIAARATFLGDARSQARRED